MMPTFVHIDVPADDPQRAKAFYETLFGWKMFGPPGFSDFYLFETEASDGSRGVGGGLGRREDPSQHITAYVGVEDVVSYGAKVEALGGKVLQSKMVVPGWGYLSICIDTEGNTFGLWQEDPNAA